MRVGSPNSAAAVVAAGAAALGVASIWVAALRRPFQFSYVEGYLVEQALRVRGGDLYRPLGEPAWIVDNFPPLYPALLAATGADAHGLWAAGRLMTMAAVVGLAWVLWRHGESRNGRAYAVAVAVAWLVLPFVLRRSVLVRMDFLAILLAVSGVLAYRSGRRGWALAAFLAAGLTRQTMLAAPLALALTMPRREALRFLGALAVLAAGAVALLSLAWPDMLRHLVLYNTGRYFPLMALAKYGSLLSLHAPLLILAAASWWRLRGSEDATDRFLVRYAPLALALAVTVGKPGSTYNHFLEGLFAAAWLVARSPPIALRGLRLPARARATALVTTQASILLVSGLVGGPLATTMAALGEGDDQLALVDRLAAAPAPVLSENAGVVVQAGHDVLLEPRTLLELHLSGRWDDAPLVSSLHNGIYSVVVTEGFGSDGRRSDGFRFSAEAWAALQETYVVEQVVGRWTVWVPQGGAP